MEVSDRGGQVTYHGPGQLVVYPIINLRDFGLGARKYVECLEDSVIDTLDVYGIKAHVGHIFTLLLDMLFSDIVYRGG